MTSGNNSLDTLKHLLAGGIAGGVSRTVVSPLERTKILFQLASSPQVSVLKCLRNIWARDGFKGFFYGNGVNVLRIVPYSAVQFAAYEQFKKFFVRSTLFTPSGEFSTRDRLCSGGLAGMSSVMFTYPLDIVRTRLSVLSNQKKLMQVFRSILHESGFLGLYNGLLPTLLVLILI